MRLNIKIHIRLVSVLMIAVMFFLQSESFSQNTLRIYDDIGGGSNSNQSSDSNDNTFIYVAGGLLIAGILVYALVLKKDKKTESDSSATMNSDDIKFVTQDYEPLNSEVQQVKENIPFDLFWGIRNDEAFINEQTYQIGVRVKI